GSAPRSRGCAGSPRRCSVMEARDLFALAARESDEPSARAQERQRAMQAELLAAVDRRRRRRLVGRSAAALSVVVLLVLVLWPGRVAMPAAPARGPAGPAAIVRVVDDAGIVARL